ncbi:solute carrier family 22 member 13 isoform X4 [Gasterosteus aculeatus]
MFHCLTGARIGNQSSFLFMQSDPERHCNTDWILQADSNLTTGQQLNLTLPRQEDGTFSRCLMFVPVERDIGDIREYGLNETTACQQGWKYHSSVYEATIVTDFDLVCDESEMPHLVQTIFMGGLLAGSFIFGPAAESYGRRRTTQLPVVLLLIFVTVAGASPNVYVYMLAQFIVGAALGGYRINSTVLATEWIGVTKRSMAACVSQMFAAVGQCAMAGLVYAIRDWRKVQFVIAGAQAFIFLYIWWIPESARWLLGQERTEEANKLIRRVAAINKKKIPENLLDEVTEKREVQSGGIRAILTSSVLMKYLFVISFAWLLLPRSECGEAWSEHFPGSVPLWDHRGAGTFPLYLGSRVDWEKEIAHIVPPDRQFLLPPDPGVPSGQRRCYHGPHYRWEVLFELGGLRMHGLHPGVVSHFCQADSRWLWLHRLPRRRPAVSFAQRFGCVPPVHSRRGLQQPDSDQRGAGLPASGDEEKRASRLDERGRGQQEYDQEEHRK